MKHAIRFIFGLIFALTFSACDVSTESGTSTPAASPNKKASTEEFAAVVAQQSRLYTTEYKIHKIVRFNDNTYVSGHIAGAEFKQKITLGDRKIAIPIDATVKAYIDFDNFGEKNVRRDGKRIVITLPDPQVEVTASKINNAEVRQYIDFPRSSFSDEEVLALARQGEDSIRAHIHLTDILQSGERSAAQMLLPLLHKMGFDEHNASIAFRRDLKPADVSVVSKH